MEARKIAVKLRRDPRETAERHSQANPLTLECTLASGETVAEAMELRAELHAAQTPQTTPLAATAAVTMTTGSEGPWELEFSGAQMNQTVLPDASEDFWLVVYAINAGDDLFTLGKMALTLVFDNISQTTPPPPDPPLYATAAFRTFAVAGQSSVVAETTQDTLTLVAGSNITITTNAATDTITIAASGGGGGSIGLTMTRTANAVTITPSGGGTAAEIPQANASDAGVMTSAQHNQLAALGTMSTQSAANVAITGGSITGITDLAIADGGTGASNAATALSNLGAYPTSNPSGFTSNTGTVTTVSVVTANGVSGSVANATTTPAITFTLGAITPTSVNGITLTNGGSGALTVTGTASIAGASSGTNTGDQTITLTGDVTGSGTGSFAATIASNAVTYAKMQAVAAASRLLGRGSAGTTAVREIALGTGLSMSGDTLSASASGGTNTIFRFFPKDAEFPSTNFATVDTRNNHPCLDFDQTTTETVYFTEFVPQGASFATSGTALTFVIESTATSATSGNIGWSVALERIVAGGIDIDADAFGTAQIGSVAVSGTSGVVSEVTVTFTLAQLSSGIAAGDQIRVRVQRNTAVSGNHSNDAELLGIYANMTPIIP